MMMKQSIKRVFGAATLALAFLALPLANAQNLPQPVAQPAPVDNSITGPTLPPDIDPGTPLGQVIRMVQSGAAENAILNNISSSSGPFNLSTAHVTYLNDLGTPSAIQAAMIQRNQALGLSPGSQWPQPATSSQSQEPQDVTEDYFYGALAPYGTWINLAGYGLCWQPCAALYDAGWTPYCTLGQWLYTDYGWYWLSGYSWGWCVFHYGRWFHDAQRGWCWRPSTTWAPSWVFWRYAGSYCGWAPVPPRCYYSQETGLMYNGASIGSGYDFGMGANLFNFVPMANLCDAAVERFRLSAAQTTQMFAQSSVLCDINSDNRIIVNSGIPVIRVAKFTSGGDIRSFSIQPVESVALPGTRAEQIMPDGETLAINRPYFVANVPSDLNQGVWPIAAQQQPVPHQPPTYIFNQIPYSYPQDDDENDNNVIFMDSAAQNGPPVPTVTTEGPQDSAGNIPSAPDTVDTGVTGDNGMSPGSYWSVSVEAPVPVYAPSAYMSPRQQSHERWSHRVGQSQNHHEFSPSAGGSRPAQLLQGRSAGPNLTPGYSQHPSSSSNGTSSHSHSSGSSDSGHGQGHGR